MLLTFTRLTRPQRFDLLSALAGEPVEDDTSLSDVAVFAEITRLVRAELRADDGELHGALRAAMTTVGDGLDLASFWGLGGRDRSWDLVSDEQLLWTSGLRIIAEARSVEDGYDVVPEALGRRVQTRSIQARRQLLARTATAPGGDLPLNETYALIDRVIRGEPSVVPALDNDSAHCSKSLVIGNWICDRLIAVDDEVLALVRHGCELPDAAVQTTSPAAAELLKTLLLDIDPDAYRRATQAKNAVTQTYRGLEVNSSRNKARRAGLVGLAATLGTAYYLRFPEPPDPLTTASQSSRERAT